MRTYSSEEMRKAASNIDTNHPGWWQEAAMLRQAADALDKLAEAGAPASAAVTTVAWLWRSPAMVEWDRPWNVTDDAEFASLMQEDAGHQVVPLYTAPTAPAVPDGWKLVPAKVTTIQRLAMAKADDESGDRYRLMGEAMLAAAPDPQS